MPEYLIWQNYNLDLDVWRDDLLAEEPELTEDQLYNRMVELNWSYLDDERNNLNIQLKERILVIAQFGLWNGHPVGYKYIQSGNIKDCLYLSEDCDYGKFFVDEAGEFRCKESHHDGTNLLCFRVFKSDLEDEQIEELEEALYNGSDSYENLVAQLTLPIGHHIAKVYGWKLGGEVA